MNSALLTMNIEEAKEKQFKLTEAIAEEFAGNEFLNMGDLGVVPGIGRPYYTKRAEKVLANFFGAEACALVRGAGTGAIRCTLSALLNPGEKLFMHKSPMYPTTKETVRMLGLKPIFVNFNDLHELKRALKENRDCFMRSTQGNRPMTRMTWLPSSGW